MPHQGQSTVSSFEKQFKYFINSLASISTWFSWVPWCFFWFLGFRNEWTLLPWIFQDHFQIRNYFSWLYDPIPHFDPTLRNRLHQFHLLRLHQQRHDHGDLLRAEFAVSFRTCSCSFRFTAIKLTELFEVIAGFRKITTIAFRTDSTFLA